MGARDLLADLHSAGLSIEADGDRLVIRPASKLTDGMRVAVRDAKPALLRLLTGDDEPKPAPSARLARLLRWGWPEPEAAALAARLEQRDRTGEVRVSCTDCRHYRPGCCANHRRAGLQSTEVARDMAALLQRCPGFAVAKTASPLNDPT